MQASSICWVLLTVLECVHNVLFVISIRSEIKKYSNRRARESADRRIINYKKRRRCAYRGPIKNSPSCEKDPLEPAQPLTGADED